MKKIAAIDIGSNAVRMLICYVFSSKNNDIFQKNSYLRLPLRLGEDSFKTGVISDKKIQILSDALNSFKYIMKVHNVKKYQIYATSALRESKNVKKVISEVQNSSGLIISLISGLEEAKIIAKGNPQEILEFNKTYIYIDVGGGSTEYSILRRDKEKVSKSFKIGTVRFLNSSFDKNVFNELSKWLYSNIDIDDKIKLFSTGGNINKIHSMSGSKTGKPISYLSIKDLYNNLIQYDYKERIIKFDLSPDRADVIIPALEIFILTLDILNLNKMFVPKVGLVDGMIKQIYYENIFKKLDS